MSWASRRKTTRLEDEAYALMGIFDVHMPTIYGEGKNAFRRLQEEIMRKSSDSSLFAWGRLQDSLPAHAPFACLDSHDLNEMYLLATSPRDFDHFVIPGSPRPRYVFAPTRRYTLRYASAEEGTRAVSAAFGVPSFEVTPYGIRAQMPVMEIDGFAIAVLSTFHGNDPLGLFVGRCEAGMDPKNPLCHPCIIARGIYRLVNLHSVIGESQSGLPTFHNRELYLAHARTSPLGRIERNVLGSVTQSPLSIPSYVFARMQDAGITVKINPEGLSVPWNGDQVVEVGLQSNDTALASGTITLGRCRAARRGYRPVWVKASHGLPSRSTPFDFHDCATDHIDRWPNGRRKTTWDSDAYPGDLPDEVSLLLGFVSRSFTSQAKTYILWELEWKMGEQVLFTTAAQKGERSR